MSNVERREGRAYAIQTLSCLAGASGPDAVDSFAPMLSNLRKTAKRKPKDYGLGILEIVERLEAAQCQKS